jgi:hypothetical protein
MQQRPQAQAQGQAQGLHAAAAQVQQAHVQRPQLWRAAGEASWGKGKA